MDSLLRLRPTQRGLKGGDGVEEPVGRRQRNLIDEILRGGDGTPVEGGDPAREYVDEAVQFGVWKGPVDVVSFRSVAIEVVRAENDFERAASTDQMYTRRGAGVKAGDFVTITLEPDTEDREIEVPIPLQKALGAKLTQKLNALSFTHKKEFVVWCFEAKKEDTRARRVEKMKQMLSAGKVIS